MKLGIIVLPDSNEELMALIKKLKGTQTTETVDDFADLTTEVLGNSPDDGLLDDELDSLGIEDEELFTPSRKELLAKLTELRDAPDGNSLLKDILTSYGAKKLGDVVDSDWPSMYKAAEEALKGFGGDDDLGLDDDSASGRSVPAIKKLDPEDVKTACQAYAQKHGKQKATALLKQCGLNSVRGIKSAPVDVLRNLYKAVS